MNRRPATHNEARGTSHIRFTAIRVAGRMRSTQRDMTSAINRKRERYTERAVISGTLHLSYTSPCLASWKCLRHSTFAHLHSCTDSAGRCFNVMKISCSGKSIAPRGLWKWNVLESLRCIKGLLQQALNPAQDVVWMVVCTEHAQMAAHCGKQPLSLLRTAHI